MDSLLYFNIWKQMHGREAMLNKEAIFTTINRNNIYFYDNALIWKRSSLYFFLEGGRGFDS